MQNFIKQIDKYSAQNDMVNAMAVINRLFVSIISNFYLWNGLWNMPYKKTLSNLSGIDPVFCQLIKEYIDEKEINVKTKKVKILYEHLTANHGGYLKGNWEIKGNRLFLNDEIKLLKEITNS